MNVKPGTIQDGNIYTGAYGWVVMRQAREPAPLLCEGQCQQLTMHRFSANRLMGPDHAHTAHDCYVCEMCGHERIWG